MMGQHHTTRTTYTECPTVDLEKGDDAEDGGEEEEAPYLQCRRGLLVSIKKTIHMLQTWDGLLMDNSLRYIYFKPSITCWHEILELKEILICLKREGETLNNLTSPMDIYTLERALREKFDLYQFKQIQFTEWSRKNGTPHLKHIMKGFS